MAHLIRSRRARPAALALVLAAGAAWFSCAEPPPQPMMPSPAAMLQDSDAQEQERLANNDAFQKRPLWFPKIDVEASTGANGWSDLAVDSRNIVHMTYQNTTGASPPYTNAIHYRNDRYESRGKSGFSGTYTVASDGERPEIAADAQDNVHVIWSVVEAGVRVLKYRHFDRSTGSWISAFSITDSDNHMDFPHLETDASNIVHIAYVRLDAANGNATQIRYIKSTQSKPTLASHFAASERVDHTIANPTPLKDKPRMDIDSGNVAHVGWIDSGANLGPGDNVKMLYGSRTGGSWSAPIRISNNASGITVASCDLSAAYSTTLQHFVWEEVGGANAIQYRKNLSGTLGTVKKINVTGTTVSVPRVISDSRTQPHILYNTDAGAKQGYASKVKRPKDSDGKDKWGRREPIEADAPSVDTMEMVANQNDNLYAVFGKEIVGSTAEPIYFSQTYEPNLGTQQGMYEWAPQAMANPCNGNVFIHIPLFLSKGVGYSTQFFLFHNSLEWSKGCMSQGWSHNYDLQLIDHGAVQNTLTVRMADGMRAVFPWDSGQSLYLGQDFFGVFASIQKNVTARDGLSASYLMQDKHGNQIAFRADGKVDRLIDTQTTVNKMSFTYTAESTTNPETGESSALLSRIADSTGLSDRDTLLEYDTKARLIKVKDMFKPTRKEYKIFYGVGPVNAGVSEIRYPPDSIGYQFTYYTTNDITNKKRVNMMEKLKTARAIQSEFELLDPYHWELKWRQDNRAITVVNPPADLIVDDADINAATQAAVTTKIHLIYEEPNLPFETPNTRKPDQVNSSYQLTVEAEEEATSNPTVSITGNNVPKVTFRDERSKDWKTEYQSLRSLADNVTDPAAKFVRMFYNSSVSGAPTTAATVRNLTVFTDKKGTAWKYEYQTGATPSWVKNNLTKIHPPKNANNENSTAPGADFESAILFDYRADASYPFNPIIKITDSRGNFTQFTTDNPGNVTEIVYPTVTLFNGTVHSNVKELFTFDGRGRMLTSRDAECQAATTYQYNDSQTGLVTDVLAPGSDKPYRLTYDNLGNVLTMTLPEGGQTVLQRDDLYRITQRTEPICGATNRVTLYTYNADSQVETISLNTADNINTFTFLYHRLGDLEYVVQPNATYPGPFMVHQFDRSRNVRRTFDFLGQISWQALYDSQSRPVDVRSNLTSKTNPPPSDVFTQTLIQYDDNDNATQMTRVGTANRVWTMTYNPRNTLATVTNPDTTVDTVQYNANDDVTKAFKKLGSTFVLGQSVDIDEWDRVRSTTQLQDEAGGGLTSGIMYDKNSNVTELIDPMGRFVKRYFDCRSRLVRTEDGKCVTQAEYVWNENDMLTEVKMTDPRGGGGMVTSARYVYCASNLLHQVFDANNVKILENTYDNEGKLTDTKDANNIVTHFDYDTLRRRTKVTRDNGGLNIVTETLFDANSNAIEIRDPRYAAHGRPYKLFYTKGNQLEKFEYPQIGVNPVNKEEWTFNSFGEVATHKDQNGKTATLTYDTSGRLTSEAHGAPFNVTISRTYTSASLLDVIDDGTVKLDLDYDVFQRATQVKWFYQGSLFKTVAYTYNASSLRETMTGPEGEVIGYGYDANNLLTSITRQKGAGSAAQFLGVVYDEGNRVREKTYGNGVKETLFREVRGLITRMLHTRSDGSVVSSVSYGYDNAAVRNSLAYDHLAVTASFTHDALYRLTGEVWTGNRNATSYTNVIGADIGNESGYSPVAKGTPGALTDVPPHYQLYGFDAAGNRTSLNGISRVSTYTVDEENRLTGETPSTLSKVTGTTAAASDTDAGYSVTKINDGDTTDSTSATYAWKSLDQTGQHWAEISWSGSKPIRQVRVFLPTSPGEVQRFKVQYDNSGTWTDVTVLAVIGATSAGGGWYKSGLHENIFAISEVSTAKVRFLQDSGGGAPSSANVAYLNELEAYEVVAGSPISYTHNANGNMTQMSQGTTVRDYGFDYANRLNSYKKTVSSLVVDDWTYLAAPTGQRFMKKQTGSSTENLFVYDGQDVIGDYTKTGGTTTYDRGYVDGLGIDSKIARIEANETQRYYISDALGSMTHMLDAGASVISTTIGNAWGEDIVFSQSTADRHGFTGRERDLDTDSGLVHFRARTYRPGIGRFLQKDPVRRISAHHAYGSNSPANLVDPLGLLAVARIQDQTEEDDLKELTKEQAETVKSHRRRSGIKRPPWADVTDIERRRFIDVPFHIIRKYFSEFPHHFKPPEPEKEPKAERREGGTTWKFVPGRAVTEEEAIFIKTVYAIGDYGVPFGWVATWLLEEYVVKGAADRALDEKVQELTKAGMPLKEAKAAVDILIAGKGIAKKFFKSVRNYRSTFFKAHPHLEGKVVVHHAVEQQVLTRYPNVFSESEIHSLGNLRGIPKELNPEVHLSRIRTMWNEFYRSHPTVTPTLKEEILKKAAEIDREVGGVFLPPR